MSMCKLKLFKRKPMFTMKSKSSLSETFMGIFYHKSKNTEPQSCTNVDYPIMPLETDLSLRNRAYKLSMYRL